MEVMRRFDILDSEFEVAFDRITQLASRMFKVPICLVSLVDAERQWFKSCIGLNVRETHRDAAFCTHAILPEAPNVLVVPDTLEDGRFCDNPLVLDAPFIRFYAGAPLRSQGQKIGTLCLIDHTPRPALDEDEQQTLMMLADMVVNQLNSRLASKNLAAAHLEQLQQSHELKALNDELTSLIDTANAPIFAVNDHLEVTVWNRKISEITSIPKEDIHGRSVELLLRPPPAAANENKTVLSMAGRRAGPRAGPSSDENKNVSLGCVPKSDAAQEVRRALVNAVRGRRCDRFDLEMVSQVHQRQIHLQVSAEPKYGADGKAVGAVCVGEDVLARKRVIDAQLQNRELQRTNEAKDAFLACMSHEMRTPLNGLLGMLQMATVSHDVSELHRFVKQARNSGMLLLNLINDILDLTRVATGQLQLECSPFDMRECLDDTFNLLHPKAAEKKLSLQLDLDKALEGRLFIGDAKRIQQVLLNLLWNALKFTVEGFVRLNARLAVSEGGAHADILFEVSDSGMGISEADQQLVFQRYSPVAKRAAAAGETNGVGLGMSICKHLVELMGGRIWLVSKLSRGTTVSVLVPLERSTEPLPKPALVPTGIERRASPLHTSVSLSILVVEDNDYNVDVCKEILELMGHRVSVAFNGQEGYHAVKSCAANEKFDMVLMDCDMPIMNGFEATRAIRKWEVEHSVQPVAIIAVTAHAMSGDKQRCFESGMDDYLTKPIMLPVLRDKLQMHYNRARHQQQPKSNAPSAASAERTSASVRTPLSSSPTDSPLIASLKTRSAPDQLTMPTQYANLTPRLVSHLVPEEEEEPQTVGAPAVNDAAATSLPSAAEAALPRASEGAPFDLAEIESFFGGSLQLVQLALDRFDSKLVDGLAALWKGRRFKELSRKAHQAKSNFGYICAHNAKHAAYRIEMAAQDLSLASENSDKQLLLDEVSSALEAVMAEGQRVRPAVKLALIDVQRRKMQAL